MDREERVKKQIGEIIEPYESLLSWMRGKDSDSRPVRWVNDLVRTADSETVINSLWSLMEAESAKCQGCIHEYKSAEEGNG